MDIDRKSSTGSSPVSQHDSEKERLNREFGLRDGIATLELLASIPYHMKLVTYWYDFVTLSMIQNWLIPIMNTIQADLHGSILTSKSEHEVRQYLADYVNRIHDNSVVPIVVTGDTSVQDYTAQIAGPRLRWESLGMYLGGLGLASMQINDHAYNEIRESKQSTMQSRLYVARRMLRACQGCLRMCSWIGQATDAESWLAVEYHHLTTLVEGDSSDASWRSLDDLLSLCSIKGLNGKISVTEDVPFWLSETRKRVFSAAYIIDKDLSTLHGRPPRLLRRYCHMQMPIDLDREVLVLTSSEVEDRLSSLDEFGWAYGRVSGMTWVRCGILLQMVREDVLNFEHSVVPVDNTSLASDFYGKNEEAWLSIPSWIRGGAVENHTSKWNHITQFVHLSFTNTKFRIARAILKKLLVGYEELIALAQELLGCTLDVVQNMTPDMAADQSWVLALSGMPAAYVLGIELLQQYQDKTRVVSTFRRSETIQNLSKIITSLRWMVPRQHGDYEFCTKARLLLQKILDLILGTTGARTPLVATNGAGDPVTSILWSDEIRSEPELWFVLSKHPLLSRPNVP